MVTAGLEVRLGLRRSERFAVSVELTVAAGTTTALLGPNGAGKTTVVSAIAGLVPVDSGLIAIDGEVVDDPAAGIFVPPALRRVGVVFQDYLLFPHLSVTDNVAFGLRRRLGRAGSRAVAARWLDTVGLAGLGRAKPADLSGGQAQRVALARALAVEPAALVLDEPLAALDVTTRAEMRRFLAGHLAGFPGPRLIITHDPTEAFLLADQVCVMEHGAITQQGTPDEIRLRPRTRYAADLAGANLVAGEAAGGEVVVDGHVLHVADTDISGPVLVTVHPTAISLHRHRPEGSPRNTWATTVELVEDLGDRVRVRTGSPLPLTAEVTGGARDDLGLVPGQPIWVAVKATELSVARA